MDLNLLLQEKEFNNDIVEKCFDILMADAHDEGKYIEKIYEVYLRSFECFKDEYLYKFHNINSIYASEYEKTSYNPQGVFYMEMHFYFESGSYSRCINYANKILDSELSTNSFKMSAISYVLTLLFKEGLVNEAARYIDEFYKLIKNYNNVSEEIVFLVNVCDIYASVKDYDKYNLSYNEIKNKIDLLDKNSGAYLIYLLHKLYQDVMLNEYNENEKYELVKRLDEHRRTLVY